MRRWILALLVWLCPALASAQITATFLQVVEDATAQTVYTYTAVNLGAAASDRYITVVSLGRKTGVSTCSQPTVTIGGVAASYIVHRDATASNCNVSAIHKANVPTGTTGDIVVTYPVTFLRSHIAVYRSTGGQTNAAAFTVASSAGDPAGSLTVPANGYAVGGSMTSSSGATATWTGLTEVFDAAMTGSATNMSTGAMLTPATLQTSLTVICDWTTSTESTGVWASWTPVASGTTPPTNLTLGVGPG